MLRRSLEKCKARSDQTRHQSSSQMSLPELCALCASARSLFLAQSSQRAQRPEMPDAPNPHARRANDIQIEPKGSTGVALERVGWESSLYLLHDLSYRAQIPFPLNSAKSR